MADFGGNKPFLDFSTLVKPCRVTPHLKDNLMENTFLVLETWHLPDFSRNDQNPKANFLLIFNGLKQNKD